MPSNRCDAWAALDTLQLNWLNSACHYLTWTVLTYLVHLQNLYCFLLPFVMKWLVAALVVSVLVDLFYRLREQGDKSPVTVTTRVQAMIAEAWQQYWRKAPSNIDMLLTFFRLNRKQKSMKTMPSFIRYEL